MFSKTSAQQGLKVICDPPATLVHPNFPVIMGRLTPADSTDDGCQLHEVSRGPFY